MPIRYRYLEAPYPPLEAYQTVFARTPGSAEMPSAARPFTARLVETLRAQGVGLVGVTLHNMSGRAPGYAGMHLLEYRNHL